MLSLIYLCFLISVKVSLNDFFSHCDLLNEYNVFFFLNTARKLNYLA